MILLPLCSPDDKFLLLGIRRFFRDIQQIPISGRRIFVTGKRPNAKRVRSQTPVPIFLAELNALYGKIVPRQDQIFGRADIRLIVP